MNLIKNVVYKKEVLHVITVSFVINHFFGNQFKYLKNLTHNNYHLGCSNSEEFLALAPKLGYIPFEVEVTRNINPFIDLLAIYKVFRYIKKNNIDTVIGHTPKGGMVAMIASFLAGVNTRIYFRHGIIYETSTNLKRFLLKNIDKLSGNLATKVVCVSESVKKTTVRDHLNAPDKNVVLGLGTCNGIDTEVKYNPLLQDNTFTLNLRNKLGISANDFVIGYVGRLVKDKGINELIAAWKLLEKNHQNLKLLLVGPIETRDSISTTSLLEINKNPNIVSTGFVLDSSPYFSLMDIFVLPTYREGFPTVALEASSMQVPVLISKATGCEESIIENQTGLFFDINAHSIAEKVTIYINNPALKKNHGEKGRFFVRKNFEQTIIWDHIYQQLGY